MEGVSKEQLNRAPSHRNRNGPTLSPLKKKGSVWSQPGDQNAAALPRPGVRCVGTSERERQGGNFRLSGLPAGRASHQVPIGGVRRRCCLAPGPERSRAPTGSRGPRSLGFPLLAACGSGRAGAGGGPGSQAPSHTLSPATGLRCQVSACRRRASPA